MNKVLDPFLVLRWIAERVYEPRWAAEGSPLTGSLDVGAIRARAFTSGTAVAITLQRPVTQASDVCLMLAATPEAYDDALYIVDNRLWLLRRYPVVLTETELDLLFQQQLALVALLAARGEGATRILPITGGYA
ncbi:hypothetical protein [Paraburkholderia sp. RL17-373-BIF-A]|uniref:hypothetical protein n=1 Tax=Paraburkholderia sp. RL17-373-BIF-A TaxID=3031629 RepID=UPI0038B926C1